MTGIPPFGSPPTPDSSTLKKGKIQLAGDLGGTAAAPAVLKINGVTISGTPSTGQAIVATGTTTASWQPITASTQRTFAYWAG